MAFKIGGTIGQIAESTKKGVKDIVEGASKVNVKDVAVGGIAGPIGIAAATDYRRGQERKKEASKTRDEAAKAESVANAIHQEAERNKSIDPMREIASRAAPQITAPEIDPAFRTAQMDLMKQLQGQAAGTAPSLAQMQQKQASNKAMQNTLGAIRSGIGSNAALAARTAALAGGNQMADLANQSAMLRLKEQQDAMSALGNLAGQGRSADAATRGQDINVATGNVQSEMQQRGLGVDVGRTILASDVGRQEGAFNRGATMEAARRRGGGSDDLLKTAITVGAPIIATMAGGPAAGAAAKVATDVAMPKDESGQAGPFRLTGSESSPQKPPLSNKAIFPRLRR